MKKKVIISSISGVVVILLLIFGVSSCVRSKVANHPFKVKSTQLEIEVKQGNSVDSVIDRLYSQGKLKNNKVIKAYIKRKNLAPKEIKPGTVTISSDITLAHFMNILEMDKKDNSKIKVTFPEGFTINDIAERLQEKGIISKDDFINACKSYSKPDYIKSDSARRYQLEGFLFPDTYEFKKGTSGQEIITDMLIRFEYVINDVKVKLNKTVNSQDYDKIITMASLVEKEAKVSEERPVVASVFYNRINKGMKLESCATVNYALNKNIVILTTADTQYKSPYNTYLNKGLPVGPICCPGRASIEAAINPASTEYLYFVANMIKNDGTMVFAKTQAEHDANVSKYEKR